MRAGWFVVVVLIGAACGSSDTPDATAGSRVDTTVAQTSLSTTPATTTPSTLPAATLRTTTTPVATTLPALLAPLVSLAYQPVASGLSRPVALTGIPGDDRLLIVERGGRIVIFEDDQVLAIPFLDISDVVDDSGIEMGLLGLALHPRYETNGRFFVYYTDVETNTHLVEFSIGPDGLGDPTSAIDLITFEQPTERHNGGNLQFGPQGYLYLSLGEGGKASVNAQNPSTLLSSILRLDVDNPDPGLGYGIPPDNPFADGVDGAPEVWAYGLRNPWRYDIDADTNMIYIADVGHEEWEEIDAVSLADGGGSNFGWLPMEGPDCFGGWACDPDLYTLPISYYPSSQGCAITGGFVYRGAAIPELDGRYLYSDWCAGWLRSLVFDGSSVVEETDWTDQVGVPGQINSFGEDTQGELYVLTWAGEVLKLIAIREG